MKSDKSVIARKIFVRTSLLGSAADMQKHNNVISLESLVLRSWLRVSSYVISNIFWQTKCLRWTLTSHEQCHFKTLVKIHLHYSTFNWMKSKDFLISGCIKHRTWHLVVDLNLYSCYFDKHFMIGDPWTLSLKIG